LAGIYASHSAYLGFVDSETLRRMLTAGSCF